MKCKLTLLASALFAAPAFATTWTTTIDEATYSSSGTITFDDHGYIGPTGVGAGDFQVTSTVTGITGFNANSIGQVQNVVTKDPDWITSDPAHTVINDRTSSITYTANMDATVNFYRWAYTTVGGSTFNNMTIDTAGNYFIARNDMSFQYYDVYQYNNGTDPVQTIDTKINFQPYAVSNATGWCGSVLTTSPDSLERMAGQVKFDFAFDVYFEKTIGINTFSSTQIVPDFVMRSYGSYEVNVAGGQVFSGSAVENNTNPVTGLLEESWKNQVSFLGAGVIPNGAWVFGDGTDNVTVAEDQSVAGTMDGEIRTDGATWHSNSFAGYAFLLRADGTRELTYVNPEGFSDYVSAPVPEPETYAMMLVGVGLIGGVVAKRGQRA